MVLASIEMKRRGVSLVIEMSNEVYPMRMHPLLTPGEDGVEEERGGIVGTEYEAERRSRVVLRATSRGTPNSRSVWCALEEEVLYLLSSLVLVCVRRGWEWPYPDLQQHCFRTDWGSTVSYLLGYLPGGMHRSLDCCWCDFRNLEMCKHCVGRAEAPAEMYPVRFLEDTVDEKRRGGRVADRQKASSAA